MWKKEQGMRAYVVQMLQSTCHSKAIESVRYSFTSHVTLSEEDKPHTNNFYIRGASDTSQPREGIIGKCL